MSVEVASLRSEPSAPPDLRGRPLTAEDPRTAFVRGHLSFVWRALRRFGVSEADAPDATQQVFMVATARLAAIEAGRERAFLFGTALRIASKVRRGNTRKPLLSAKNESEPDEQLSDWPSAEQLVDQRRARGVLDEILAGMPEAQRAVFVLYEVEEMTMAEIAGMLELPAGTVASRLRRAREYFQECVARRAAHSGETP